MMAPETGAQAGIASWWRGSRRERRGTLLLLFLYNGPFCTPGPLGKLEVGERADAT